MNAVLLVTKGKNQMVKTEITRTPFLIGRAKDCGLSLDEDLASRQHTEITLERGAYQVRDNGQPQWHDRSMVKSWPLRRQLMDGDQIEIGSTRIKFIFDGSRPEKMPMTMTRHAWPRRAAWRKNCRAWTWCRKAVQGDIRVKLRVVGRSSGRRNIYRDWESPPDYRSGIDQPCGLGG